MVYELPLLLLPLLSFTFSLPRPPSIPFSRPPSIPFSRPPSIPFDLSYSNAPTSSFTNPSIPPARSRPLPRGRQGAFDASPPLSPAQGSTPMGGGAGDVICTSLPSSEPDSNKLYFGCSCRDRYGDAEFETGQFISRVDPSIYNRDIVINIRDCWGLKLTLNEDDLYRTESKYFRPDLFLSKIFLENIVEIHLNGSRHIQESLNDTTDYIRLSEAAPVSVTLYDVERIFLHDALNLDLIQTENPDTVLNVGLTNLTESRVRIRGFRADNIMVAGTQIQTNQKAEFSHVLVRIAESMTSTSLVLSLVLVACVCVVGLGVGAALFAVAKRHQYLIQAVVYASFDSLRRNKKPAPESPDDVTTTSVSFFPKYSIVMKQNKGSGPSKLVQVEQPLEKKKRDKTEEKASVRSKLSKISDFSSVGRRYLSTETHDRRENGQVEGKTGGSVKKRVEEKREDWREVEETKNSFYYRPQSDTSASSKSDLTLRSPQRIEAQVHRAPSPTAKRTPSSASSVQTTPSPPFSVKTSRSATSTRRPASKSPRPPKLPMKIGIYSSKDLDRGTDKRTEVLGSSSPQPLIETDRKYSFMVIREKCRQLISLKPLSTKL